MNENEFAEGGQQIEIQAFLRGLLRCEGSRPKTKMPALYALDANVAC
jgi:hypothetical protein